MAKPSQTHCLLQNGIPRPHFCPQNGGLYEGRPQPFCGGNGKGDDDSAEDEVQDGDVGDDEVEDDDVGDDEVEDEDAEEGDGDACDDDSAEDEDSI